MQPLESYSSSRNSHEDAEGGRGGGGVPLLASHPPGEVSSIPPSADPLRDDLRNSSIAALRQKAQEHTARLIGLNNNNIGLPLDVPHVVSHGHMPPTHF